MKFRKYNDIESTYRRMIVDQIIGQGLSDGMWEAREKLHGSNLSMWCDGKEVRLGKRKGWTDTDFYNCGEVLERYEQTVFDLFELFSDTEELAVYGELYGDGVQKGIKYPPGKHFAAFDIRLNNEYIDHNTFENICEAVNIPTTPLIAAGSFEEMLELDPRFDSKILGEPNNLVEGLVIKPFEPRYLNNGSRVILKKKNEKFQEVSKEKNKQKEMPLSDSAKKLVEDLTQYLTENRLRNVISKEGRIEQKEFGKLMGLFVQDAIQDFEKDTGVQIKEQYKDEWKRAKKYVNAEAAIVIRPNFVNIIDGSF